MDKYQRLVLDGLISRKQSETSAFVKDDAKDILPEDAKQKVEMIMLSLVVDGWLRSEHVGTYNTCEYYLTYSGLNYKRVLRSRIAERVLGSIFVPIAVAVVTTLILQLIEFLPRLLEQILLNGGPYPGN